MVSSAEILSVETGNSRHMVPVFRKELQKFIDYIKTVDMRSVFFSSIKSIKANFVELAPEKKDPQQ